MWGAHDGMGWWMVLGSVWFVGFWGAVFFLVSWATSRGRREQRSDETPLDILRRRYARGEISRDEFDRMRQELS